MLHRHREKQRGKELNFIVSVEIKNCILLLYSSFCLSFCLSLFVYVTLGFAELNFIVCITLSRYIMIINPELISSNQDTGTNRVTTCQTYFAPTAALT